MSALDCFPEGALKKRSDASPRFSSLWSAKLRSLPRLGAANVRVHHSHNCIGAARLVVRVSASHGKVRLAISLSCESGIPIFIGIWLAGPNSQAAVREWEDPLPLCGVPAGNSCTRRTADRSAASSLFLERHPRTWLRYTVFLRLCRYCVFVLGHIRATTSNSYCRLSMHRRNARGQK